MIDAKPFKGQIPARPKLRLHGALVEDGRLHAHLRHAVFDHVELHRDDAGHLDGAAEGDFAVSLREVEVADGEFGARDVHGEVDFAASAEVFDVAVSAVFRAALI